MLLLGGHVALWRALLFVGYDPMGARVQGMPVRALNAFLFLSVGLAVALCTRALGALPVFAFSVLPAMAALALTARIGAGVRAGAVLGAFSGVGGYAVSFRRRPARRRHADRHRRRAAALAALAWRFAKSRYERSARARTASAPRTDAA